MFVAEYRQTMKNARPKFEDPQPVVRTIEQMRAEKRIETERLRREQARAWVARMEARHQAEMARQAAELDLPDFVPHEGFCVPERKIPVMEIISGVAATHHMPVAAILSSRRDRPAVAARFEAIVAVRNEHPGLSLSQLGRIFKRDHSSIHHSLTVMAKKSGGIAA